MCGAVAEMANFVLCVSQHNGSTEKEQEWVRFSVAGGGRKTFDIAQNNIGSRKLELSPSQEEGPDLHVPF